MFFKFQQILIMKNKQTSPKNIFVSEEEKTIRLVAELQLELKKNFGEEIYQVG